MAKELLQDQVGTWRMCVMSQDRSYRLQGDVVEL